MGTKKGIHVSTHFCNIRIRDKSENEINDRVDRIRVEGMGSDVKLC